MKRTSRGTVLLKGRNTMIAIKASERSQYWHPPAFRLAKRAAERTQYRMGHSYHQRYVMACCTIKKLQEDLHENLYKSHVRDLHKTTHITYKACMLLSPK